MLAIFVAILMILSALVIALPQGREYGINPAASASSQGNIQPNPTLNTNVSWSTFNSTWAPLEYYNGTSYENLSGSESALYANPISINPADITSTQLTGNNLLNWDNASSWANTYSTNGGGVTTLTKSQYGIQITSNESQANTQGPEWTLTIPDSALPSTNPSYDYLTVIYNSSVPAGASIAVNPTNNSNKFVGYAPLEVSGSGTILQKGASTAPEEFYSISLAAYAKSTGIQFNQTIGNGYTADVLLTVHQNLPEGSTTVTTTIRGISLTEYPFSLGQNSTGSDIFFAAGSAHLSRLSPTNPIQITDRGYSVAVSQPLQNLTTQQDVVSSGNYIEQVEYQGQFDLPTAPDLSYGPANLTEVFNISTSQTQVLDINGVSYLSSISGKNGTITLLSSANPNEPTQFLQIVDYTQSQWNSISTAPGIFTIAGIEYYWWIAVGGLAALIGLAAAAKHAGTKADQERIRRGR